MEKADNTVKCVPLFDVVAKSTRPGVNKLIICDKRLLYLQSILSHVVESCKYIDYWGPYGLQYKVNLDKKRLVHGKGIKGVSDRIIGQHSHENLLITH